MTPLKVSCLLLFALPLAGCHLPGKPSADDIVPRPTAVTSFPVLYGQNCAGCHGAPGAKPGPAGNILDGSLLALVNAQMLRTTIIAGRPDLGQPDFRGDIPGHPLTDAEVTDLTEWMLAQRPSDPGQPYASRNPMSPPSGGKAQPQAPFGPPPGQSRIP
jgi:mono/diheme cytochrome c family protein